MNGVSEFALEPTVKSTEVLQTPTNMHYNFELASSLLECLKIRAGVEDLYGSAAQWQSLGPISHMELLYSIKSKHCFISCAICRTTDDYLPSG